MSPFEAIKHEEDGVEYWSARELAVVLRYTKWRNFKFASIGKAEKLARAVDMRSSDHFAHAEQMVQIGSGSATRD